MLKTNVTRWRDSVPYLLYSLRQLPCETANLEDAMPLPQVFPLHAACSHAFSLSLVRLRSAMGPATSLHSLPRASTVFTPASPRCADCSTFLGCSSHSYAVSACGLAAPRSSGSGSIFCGDGEGQLEEHLVSQVVSMQKQSGFFNSVEASVRLRMGEEKEREYASKILIAKPSVNSRRLKKTNAEDKKLMTISLFGLLGCITTVGFEKISLG
ncbi:hypothetical protein NDU88_003312 [Pleurodeles waltl]|uniref:Uncharacterized protein n=1 Tax=Pleurodeles waltl TaxID=8319 RepID=A0AAV7VGS5_PLEWA|nr:hypothetical protein NDU88_003312 [Pleurodeles waltl]